MTAPKAGGDQGPKGANHRQYERFPTDLRATLIKGKTEVPGRVVDVSFSGLFFTTDNPPPLRDLVKLEIELPSGEAMRILGMAVHVVRPARGQRQRPGVGVQLFGIGPDIRAAWDRFVAGVRASQLDGAAEPTTLVPERDGSSGASDAHDAEAVGAPKAGLAALIQDSDDAPTASEPPADQAGPGTGLAQAGPGTGLAHSGTVLDPVEVEIHLQPGDELVEDDEEQAVVIDYEEAADSEEAADDEGEAEVAGLDDEEEAEVAGLDDQMWPEGQSRSGTSVPGATAGPFMPTEAQLPAPTVRASGAARPEAADDASGEDEPAAGGGPSTTEAEPAAANPPTASGSLRALLDGVSEDVDSAFESLEMPGDAPVPDEGPGDIAPGPMDAGPLNEFLKPELRIRIGADADAAPIRRRQDRGEPVLFKTDVHIPMGTEIQLRVLLQDGQTAFLVDGQVVDLVDGQGFRVLLSPQDAAPSEDIYITIDLDSQWEDSPPSQA